MASVQGSGTAPVITVSGASYVNLSGFYAIAATGSAVLITGSNHITFDSNVLESNTATQPALHVTGDSTNVTISRNEGFALAADALVLVDSGGTGDQITTNDFGRSNKGPTIMINGMPNVAVTSNTTRNSCGAGIQVTGGSTATIENNMVSQIFSSSVAKICPVPQSAAYGLIVDASSAAGSTADYNIVDAAFGGYSGLDYSWAGTSYTSAAAFVAATGQGAHDFNSPTVPNPAAVSGTSPSYIDSANADAPGELPTDVLGHARVDDPIVPNTGIGTQTYYDRGAQEAQPATATASLSLSGQAGNVSMAPVGATVTLTSDIQDPWDAALTCNFDFGDGASTKVAATGNVGETCSTTHQYTTKGAYTPTLSLKFSDGTSTTVDANLLTIGSPAPVVPTLTLAATSSTMATPSCSATSGWTVDIYSIDFGDGSQLTACYPHIYQRPGTYVVTMTVMDAGGNSAKTSVQFTTLGDFYTPLTPSRILDTRTGTGTSSPAKVPAGGVLKLKVAGASGVPASGAAAVTLNVTVTGPSAGGYLTAYPDGAARPGTSNLNFSAGQTVPNTVVVKIGADGYVDLANGSAGATNLVADVEGYYGVAATSGYGPITPIRVMDTRTINATIPAGGTSYVAFAGYPDVSAVALNVTVVNAKAGGYITAYPNGEPMPKASNVNFDAGRTTQNETIVKVGADDVVDFTNTSAGSTDLIVDMTGYFAPDWGEAFVPITPTRVLDTRPNHGGGGPVAADSTVPVPMTGNGAIAPGTPRAIAANVTVTGPTAGGYITAYPDDVSRPLTSVLNFTSGQTIPNAATIGVGQQSGGGILLFNGSAGTVQLVADVFGFYS